MFNWCFIFHADILKSIFQILIIEVWLWPLKNNKGVTLTVQRLAKTKLCKCIGYEFAAETYLVSTWNLTRWYKIIVIRPTYRLTFVMGCIFPYVTIITISFWVSDCISTALAPCFLFSAGLFDSPDTTKAILFVGRPTNV